MNTQTVITASALAITAAAQAGLTTGMYAELQFQQLHMDLGGNYIDFESVSGGTNLLPGTDPFGAGARFASVIQTNGTPFGPEHVEVSNRHRFAEFGNTIVGSPCGGCTDDGRVGYQIEFDELQGRAAIRRVWNTGALTSFYNAAGELLATHQNTTSAEFVGYIADSEDQSTWVARILIDGLSIDGTRQVGYSDDLYFGTQIPAPSALSALMLAGFATKRRRK